MRSAKTIIRDMDATFREEIEATCNGDKTTLKAAMDRFDKLVLEAAGRVSDRPRDFFERILARIIEDSEQTEGYPEEGGMNVGYGCPVVSHR